jgi:hypothetical protein
MNRSLAALSLLLSLALGGCSLVFGELPLVVNECTSDADCAGATCEVSTGMCITVDPSPMRLGLALFPASETAPGAAPGVSFPPVDVEGPANLDLVLPATILAAGNVIWAATGEAVPAQLRFVRASAFDGGAPTEISGATAAHPVELSSGIEVDYQIRVPVGRVYDLHVEPTGDAARVLPPLVLRGVASPLEGDIWKLDITYPSDFVRVEGSIVSVSDDEEVPENGLQVRAVEVATGRVVSSTALTGMTSTLPLLESSAGSFEIRLAPGSGPFVLRVSAGDDRPLFPTLTIDPDLEYPGSVVVPQLVPVRYEGIVEAETSEGRVALDEAIVSMRSQDVFGDLSGITGTFRATVTTDAQGRFVVDVLPGTYDVVVTPAGHTELAVLAQRVRIEGGNEEVRGQLFSVPARARLSGSVQVADGRPMPEATVRASALRWAMDADDAVGPFNRSNDTTTDGHGMFTLHVDTGVFDITARPPAGSRFPWAVSPAWVFDSYGLALVEQIKLFAPVPMRGRAHSSDGMPLGGAEVRAFGILEGPEGTVRAVEVGRAAVDAEGAYELLLPPFF